MGGVLGMVPNKIAGVNFAIGVCARLNIRNMIPVLSLGETKISDFRGLFALLLVMC